MSSSNTGDIAEQCAIIALLKRGHLVSKPIGKYRYDLISDHNNKLSKIQVKAGLYSKGVLMINQFTATYKSNNQANDAKVHRYTKDEIDAYCIVWVKENRVYLVPIEEVEDKVQLRLRVEPAKNNQQQNVIFADKYEISGAVAQLV